MDNNTVTIDRDEYIQLLIHTEMLNQLHMNGIDNLSSYGCMCLDDDDDECIFCTDNQEKYLGVDYESN